VQPERLGKIKNVVTSGTESRHFTLQRSALDQLRYRVLLSNNCNNVGFEVFTTVIIPASGMCCRANLVRTYVSEESVASVFGVEKYVSEESVRLFFTLKMEVTRSSETSVLRRFTRCHIPENCILKL
jgi:hypothetical protein